MVTEELSARMLRDIETLNKRYEELDEFRKKIHLGENLSYGQVAEIAKRYGAEITQVPYTKETTRPTYWWEK